MKITSHKLFFPVLLIIAFIASYSYTFDPKIAQLGDNASYYILGKSISAGEGYVNISKVTKSPNNHYPPGYPLILSLPMLFTMNISLLKLLNGLFLAGSVLILFKISERLSHSALFGFVCGLAMLGNYHIQQYGSILMSEIPFTFFSLLSIYFVIQWQSASKPMGLYFWLALLSAIAAYYIRSLGIALVAGIIFYQFTERQWKSGIVFLGGFVLAALPWFIRSQQLGGGSYFRQLMLINPYRPELGNASGSDFISRFTENFIRYITTEIPYALFAGEMPDYQSTPGFSDWLLGLFISALILYGFFTLKKVKWLVMGYVLATFGILMFWPDVWVGVRFMIPLIPLLFIGLFKGLYEAIDYFFRQAKRSFSFAWLIVPVIFMSASLSQLHDQAKIPLHPAWQNYYAMAEWLKANESSDVVVSCGKPSLFYLYSGTYTMRYAFEDEPDKLIRDLEERQVDYVVLDQVYGNTLRYLLPAIKAYPDRFEQIYYRQNPDTFLLRFKD